MDIIHHHIGLKGQKQLFLKEIENSCAKFLSPLQRSNIKHCDWNHHQLACDVLSPGQKGYTAGDQNCWEHLWYQISVILVRWGACAEPQGYCKDITYLSYSLFTLLPSWKRYRSFPCCTARLKESFILKLQYFSTCPMKIVFYFEVFDLFIDLYNFFFQ